MKKLLFIIPILLFMTSCNQEISEDQFRAQMSKQCPNQIGKTMMGKDASEQELEEFCDCYIDIMLDGKESITAKEMFSLLKNTEAFQEQLENCKAQVQNNSTPEVETPTVDPVDEQEVEEQLESN